jgi:putative MFS transporter
MALIIGGTGLAAYGLLPSDAMRLRRQLEHMTVTGLQDAPLRASHWVMMGALIVALVIDVMKPAALGFTLSGMTLVGTSHSEQKRPVVTMAHDPRN